MISTQFQIATNGETSRGQWVALAVPVVLCATVAAGFSRGPVGALGLALFGACVGVIFGGLAVLVIARRSPQQSIVTTLESDGVTLWAFNERRPDVNKRGRGKLFSVPLDKVGRCEIGAAYTLFGKNIKFGIADAITERADPYAKASGAVQVMKNMDEQEKRESTAVYLTSENYLNLVWAGMAQKAELYTIASNINEFLQRAKNSTPAPLSSSGSPAPSSVGFDL